MFQKIVIAYAELTIAIATMDFEKTTKGFRIEQIDAAPEFIGFNVRQSLHCCLKTNRTD